MIRLLTAELQWRRVNRVFEFLAHGGGRTLSVYSGQEHCEFVDLLLVTSLELINGRAKRSRSS